MDQVIKKCKHLNCAVTECGTWYTSHMFEGGIVTWHNNESGDYSYKIRIECTDCGLDKYYYVNNKSTPKWVQRLYDLALDNGEQ